jgi:transcriptional regulator with XRE-family HTH domain
MKWRANLMTAGQRIQQCRKTKKLSQEYVATVLGVSRQAVSKWENDLSVPDTVNYINLAKIFGVSVEYLAFGVVDAAVKNDSAVSSERDDEKNNAVRDETAEQNPEKSNFVLFLGFLLYVIGAVVILLALLVASSLLLYLIGILAIVLAKKIMMD